MALGRKVVDLVGLNLLKYADQVGGIGQISVMQDQVTVFFVGGPGRGDRCGLY